MGVKLEKRRGFGGTRLKGGDGEKIFLSSID